MRLRKRSRASSIGGDGRIGRGRKPLAPDFALRRNPWKIVIVLPIGCGQSVKPTNHWLSWSNKYATTVLGFWIWLACLAATRYSAYTGYEKGTRCGIAQRWHRCYSYDWQARVEEG